MSEPVWIDAREATVLHEQLLALHGGRAGVREAGLLESALSRPRNRWVYRERSGIVELAAAYTAGVVGNHPFIDGNKRTGFVVGVLFLELNGYQFFASEENAVEAVLALAAGAMNEDGYAAFLAANSRMSNA
ncbi:MAG TPA: type II toxin-antitoxin system death-on-curing family toxin [Roseiarcus sp.]